MSVKVDLEWFVNLHAELDATYERMRHYKATLKSTLNSIEQDTASLRCILIDLEGLVEQEEKAIEQQNRTP